MSVSRRIFLFNKHSASTSFLSNFLSAYHTLLRGTWLEYLTVLIIFSLLVVVYTNFIALNITSQMFVDGPGDATAGFLWYNFADPGLSPFLGVTDYVNYPYGEKMGAATFITYSAIWLPLRLLSYIFGHVAGINLLMMWGFLAAGMGGYWLVKRLTGSVFVAFFAGFALAFVPYHLYKSSIHIAYIFAIVFILIIAAFIALWSRPTKLRGALFGAAIALAFYTDGYYVLLSTVLVLSLVVSGLLHGIIFKFKAVEYWNRVKVLLIALLTLLIMLIPVAYVQITQGSEVSKTLGAARGDIGTEIRTYRSNPIDFILPPIGNPILPVIDPGADVALYKNLRSNPSESQAYIGFILIALSAIGFAMIGIWIVRKRHSTLVKLDRQVVRKYVLVGCITLVSVPVFLSFMFSPDVYILGYTIKLPGQFLIDHNIALWRVMTRFFIPLHVVIAIFAAFTLWIVINNSKLINKSKNKTTLTSVIIITLTLFLALEYRTAVNTPSFDINKEADAYHWLKRQSSIKAIAEFPMVDPLDMNATRYVTSQLFHQKKLVNMKEAHNRQTTNTLGTIDNPEAIDFAYSRGAQVVVAHQDDCHPVKWGRVLYVDKMSKICIYSLDREVATDDIYVDFNAGFAHTSNEPNSAKSFVKIADQKMKFSFIDDKFRPIESTSVRMTASINPWMNNTLDGQWVIRDEGRIIASGQMLRSTAVIDITFIPVGEVELEIKITNALLQPKDLQLNDTVAVNAY